MQYIFRGGRRHICSSSGSLHPPYLYTPPLSAEASGTTLLMSLPDGTLSAPGCPLLNHSLFPNTTCFSSTIVVSTHQAHSLNHRDLLPNYHILRSPQPHSGDLLHQSLEGHLSNLQSYWIPFLNNWFPTFRSSKFVEMKELLPDNVDLAELLAALPQGLRSHKQPEQREVGSLTTRMASFATYIAIVAQICVG